MAERISALLVEDNPADARLMQEFVRDSADTRIHLTHVLTLGQALARVGEEHFDVIMLDLSLPDAEGLDTLLQTHSRAPNVPIVVLTGLNDEALAVKAVREGAQDYLVKGQVDSALLIRSMKYATERKRAIEELQKREEYFRSLIENALDIITVLNDRGTIMFASPSVRRVLGYDADDLIGRNIFEFMHPEESQRIQVALEFGTLDPRMTQSFEFRMKHRNGSWRVLEAIGKRFDRESGAGFVLNSRDITERRHAEDMLREANETLRAVIETSPLGIYSLDPQKKVRSWNSAAERIFGYSESDVLGRFLPTVFPEDEETFRGLFEEAFRGQTIIGIEARRRRKDGSPIDVSLWSAPLRDAGGTVNGVVVAVADNTERKRLEEQFRQAQKMEAVGRLAGGVAHDFNNLLTVITGYCQMLVDRLPAGDSVRGDMEQVLKAADRATALTKQLLAFSRKQIVQPKVVDLPALLSDMEHILKRLLGENNEFTIEAVQPLGKVKVDPGQIEQVILNLAVNARDAMPGGGKLSVTLRNIDVSDPAMAHRLALDPGPYVLMSVSDTGVGMNAETRAHLFEPFFTTKEKGRGTGLGLSTSYGIVKQNRGEIQVESETGMGSTFHVYLPRVEDQIELDFSAGRNGGKTRGSETVMVVEDEEGVRRVVVQMLTQLGYNVLTASGGPDAIDRIRAHHGPLHLLITDVVMPKMSGRELADMVRRMRPDVRMLFVSGYTDTAIVHHGVLDPGTFFLQKPFTPEALAAKVREVLDSR